MFEFSTSKNHFFIGFNESPLKIMKNAFYMILKALFILNIFKFLSWLFLFISKKTGKTVLLNSVKQFIEMEA